MSLRIWWTLFFATVVVLVILVVGLNCLQGAAPLKLFGVLGCDYSLTSSDFRVKAGGAAIFLLFLVMLFSPIAAVLGRPRLARRPKVSA